MDIDIFKRALHPVAEIGTTEKSATILFTEYRAELETRSLSYDELLDVAAFSMVNAELDADRNNSNISVLNRIIDDCEATEATLAELPWDEIADRLKTRIEQMQAAKRDRMQQALAMGLEISQKQSARNDTEMMHAHHGGQDREAR